MAGKTSQEPNTMKIVHPNQFLVAIAVFIAWVVSATPAEAQTDLAYREHIQQLKKDLPEGDFRIQIERPFVVIGDESPEMLQRRCKSIRWAVDHLKAQYFKEDPDRVINIWLFKDKISYETNVEAMFGEKPGTPFGYYSSRHRALVMNISTGGGTLVHEIVHPFIERNFADCPAWFNEGLASLYEQSGEREGKIVGFTNWRLSGLQRAIHGKRLPDFKTLCETTTREFYDQDRGTNYAQARYLCYYLQQQGKLDLFYREFVAKAGSDPGGYQTLVKILKTDDMEAFQRSWQEFVMNLKFE